SCPPSEVHRIVRELDLADGAIDGAPVRSDDRVTGRAYPERHGVLWGRCGDFRPSGRTARLFLAPDTGPAPSRVRPPGTAHSMGYGEDRVRSRDDEQVPGGVPAAGNAAPPGLRPNGTALAPATGAVPGRGAWTVNLCAGRCVEHAPRLVVV